MQNGNKRIPSAAVIGVQCTSRRKCPSELAKDQSGQALWLLLNEDDIFQTFSNE